MANMQNQKNPDRNVSLLAKRGARNLVVLLIVVALFIGGLFIYSQNLAKELASSPATLAASGQQVLLAPEKVEPMLYRYDDEELGFSIKYPVTYKAEMQPEPLVRLRFSASNPASTFEKPLSAEVIEVSASDNATAFDGGENIAAELGVAYNRTKINGVTAYRVNGKMAGPVFDEQLFVRAAFFDCLSPEGTSYAAAIVAIVPENLEPDLLLVDYLINGFTC